jgi:hypothetical protein
MKYSQPFGTPDPPLGTYPRFVNGNPVTGTEGSIPPATAFDEDQIEIITVIQNAGLTPDHGDLTQLWQALMALFAQKYITTPITKTIHGAGADFPDLIAAFNWVAQYIITPTGSVTFLCASGTWNYTQTVEVNHPNADRIVVTGPALTGASPAQNQLSVTWPITGTSRQTDGTNQHNQLKGIYACELSFLGGVSGFRVYRGGVTIRYLLISGTQTVAQPHAGDPGGCGICAFATVVLDGTAVWGFGNHGYYSQGGAFLSYTSLSIIASFCNSCGFWTFGGLISFLSNQNVISTSHGSCAFACFGTEVYSGIVDARGIATPKTVAGGGASNVGAVTVEQGTQFMMGAGSLVRYCNNQGCTVADCSTLQLSGSTVMDCSVWQIWMNNGVCWAEGSNIQQTAGTVYPNGGVAVLQNGAQLSLLGAVVGGSVFPTPNTYNMANNSFVRM